jgi:hypothetical protein
MQTFEQAKNELLVLGINANPVVSNREHPTAPLPFSAHMHGRGAFWAAVFYGVP